MKRFKVVTLASRFHFQSNDCNDGLREDGGAGELDDLGGSSTRESDNVNIIPIVY